MIRGEWILSCVALAMLVGCGGPERQKGPALPYNPDKLVKEWTEADFKLREDLPKVLLKTSQGDIEVTLFEDEAPNTVANFISLVEKKFYDGLTFHRIMANFCVQGGDPKGDGSGGPGYRVPPEFPDMYHKNEYGTVACAKQEGIPEMSGSQFYFNINKEKTGNLHLDGKHVVFGTVSKGLDVLEKLAAVKVTGDKPVEPQKILSVTVLSKRNHVYKAVGLVPDKDELKSEEKTAAKTEAKTEEKTEAKTEVKTGAKSEETKTGEKSAEKTGAKSASAPAKEAEKSK